jgi:hypothetical protein
MEQEENKKLNFLDITIARDKNKLTYEIYRKPTTSDTIIPKDSCHPIEQKLAAIRYFVNRIHTYDLDHTQKQKEINTVKDIIGNNKYNESTLLKVQKKREQRMISDEQKQNQNQKWIKFTYIGKETWFVTKLFKNTRLKGAYTTNNSIAKLLNTQKVDTNQTKPNSVALVREQTIPTERPPPVGEVSANFCG